jgi:hypothetical protein
VAAEQLVLAPDTMVRAGLWIDYRRIGPRLAAPPPPRLPMIAVPTSTVGGLGRDAARRLALARSVTIRRDRDPRRLGPSWRPRRSLRHRRPLRARTPRRPPRSTSATSSCTRYTDALAALLPSVVPPPLPPDQARARAVALGRAHLWRSDRR